MAFLAFILGSLLALTGAVGVVAPGVLATVASILHGPFALALATVLRLVLGAALVVAAPPSRAPTFFRGLGVAIFTLGLLTPLIGVARFDAILDSWATLARWQVRLWAALATVVGGAIAYGIIPRSAR